MLLALAEQHTSNAQQQRQRQRQQHRQDHARNYAKDSNSNTNCHQSMHKTRVEMVRAENGKLVPVLLRFLNRCMFHSKEHNLTLLILSKLSIPQENKKIIAIDYNGAEILAKLLCEDPSCHLVALVLVNLTCDLISSEAGNTTAIEVTATAGPSGNKTNTIDVVNCDTGDRVDGNGNCNGNGNGMGYNGADESSLRRQLLATNGEIALVESLAFALRVASLTRDEYASRQATVEDCNFSDEYLSPATRLSILMAKDQQLRSRKEEEERREQEETKAKTEIKTLRRHMSADQILLHLRSNEREPRRLGTMENPSPKTHHQVTCSHPRRAPASRSSRHKRCHASPPPPMHEESLHVYPKTAKWCLKALRNLTKPSNHDATAAHVLIKSGIYSLIVQYITTVAPCAATEDSLPDSSLVANPDSNANSNVNTSLYYQIDSNFLSASYGGVYVRNAAADERSGDDRRTDSVWPSVASNYPCLWDSNSLQDAALFIVYNLAASSRSREYMNEPNTVEVLSMVAKCPIHVGKAQNDCKSITTEQEEVMAFQCLKARMALSYLVGSQGHFGQTKLRSAASTAQANSIDSPLIMTYSDVQRFVELLANTIHRRGKDNLCGGRYLSGTFELKSVIFSLRCLLTHTTNQERIVALVGTDLNLLLINALAQFVLEPSASVLDSESAEHVVFSLYLLSNHGLEKLPFLPETYAPDLITGKDKDDKDDGLAAKILFSYLSLSKIPPAARHAARQLLLRVKYLKFGKNRLLASKEAIPNVVSSVDLKIDYILLAKIKRVQLSDWKYGTEPDALIFQRSVLRRRKPHNWERSLSPEGEKKKDINWVELSSVVMFESALIAVQQLSYGSVKVRRSSSELIDDIAIANDIARSANNDKSGCYGFLWAWEDAKISDRDDQDGDNDVIRKSAMYNEDRLLYQSIVEGIGLSRLRRSRSFTSSSNSSDSSYTSISSFGDEELSLLQICCSANPSDYEGSEI
eukprot:jgi/Psemu1/289649/fgenesh1_pg.383_\